MKGLLTDPGAGGEPVRPIPVTPAELPSEFPEA